MSAPAVQRAPRVRAVSEHSDGAAALRALDLLVEQSPIDLVLGGLDVSRLERVAIRSSDPSAGCRFRVAGFYRVGRHAPALHCRPTPAERSTKARVGERTTLRPCRL